MEKIKRLLLFNIPMSICNFRCGYCYLSQRPIHYQGMQPEKRYTPEQVARALSVKRLGGVAYMNFCADGETLLTRDLDLYVKALVENGHYAEIVTNCTVSPMIDKFLTWDRELLKRLTFKCSFHYLELKRCGLLEEFSRNVNKIWSAGASASIEIVPSDELISYIDELKDFSIRHFGALPHLTIARDDRTANIDYLTDLSIEDYNKTWSQFESQFWEFKKSIFGVKQHGYCYAGDWGLFIDFITGDYTLCYTGRVLGNLYDNPEDPIKFKAIGHCPYPHCYNGHALMTMGLIPRMNYARYGDIRDRQRTDGSNWLHPDLLEFFNGKPEDSNSEYSLLKKISTQASDRALRVLHLTKVSILKLIRKYDD